MTTFNEYQENIRQFISYNRQMGPFATIMLLYQNVGILSQKIYSLLNSENSEISDEDKIKIAISIGDALSDLTNMASDLQINMNDIIALNLRKYQLSNNTTNNTINN